MKVGTQYLFPLSKLNSTLKDYFVSVDGKFFSTKQSPAGRQMHGAGPSTPYLRSCTMAGPSRDGRTMYLAAKQHDDFVSETRPPSTRPVDARTLRGTPSGRNHAMSVNEGLADKGWVIAQVAVHEGVEHLLFGSKPAIHMSEASYKDEMQRLALSKHGTKFVALKVVASVVSGGVTWE